MRNQDLLRQTSVLILISAVFGGQVVLADRPLLYSKEEPIRVDFDMNSIPEPVGDEDGYLYDMINGTFFQQAKQAFDFPRNFRKIAGRPKEAYNVNVLDETPNSSWFTNRNGMKQMTLEEIKRGPNVNSGPAEGPLTVLSGKEIGASPGFRIRDSRGDVYILKFDPPDHPELATAAEVIATKLFYAIGYNVPQNTIFRFRREQLQLDQKATVSDMFGKKKPMTEGDIDIILNKSARQSDGRHRCVASKLLDGKPKGGFDFQGVRKDDPNDIIPHEHRRDLRGLRVFAAWLNHNDLRVANTLDMYVSDGDRQFLSHYLIDFGSTLGSETLIPNPPPIGNEYRVDGGEAMKALLSLGIYQQPWLTRERKLLHPSVGYYSAEHFDPQRWKQNFPLTAFENMTDRDAYWAAKIVASFSDEQIAAAVETGELSDPAAARYLTDQLIKRRDLIKCRYFLRQPALDRFVVKQTGDGFILQFEDLRAESLCGQNGQSSSYEYELRPAAGPKKELARGTLSEMKLTLSPALLEKIGECGKKDADRSTALLSLRRRGEEKAARVYLYYDSSKRVLRVIGVDASS